MTVIATALKHMLAAGMDHDAIVAAVAEMEASMPSSEPKKSKGAERQARYRERHKTSQSVTCDAENVTDHNETVTSDAERNAGPLPLPPNDLISNPPTPTPEHKTTRARGKHSLPADWEPQQLTGDTAAAVAGWPPGAVDRELARFRDWAAGGGPNSRKENWDATWRNWLRRAQDDGRYRNVGTARGHSGPASTVDAVQRALELTGGTQGREPDGSQGRDHRIGQVPDPMRALGHVQR